MGISWEQALDCFNSDDLIGIGMEADAVRRKLHPEGVVSYAIDRKIDCATAPFEALYQQIHATVEMGGTGVTLRQRVDAERKIDWYEELFAGVREQFPALWLHCLSASEILAIAVRSRLTVRDTILRLRDAGLRSIPGDDAGILDDAVQQQSGRDRWTVADWVSTHRTAHELGIRTTAGMTFGVGESFEQRLNHLDAVRQLQEETGGFTAFTPVSFQPRKVGVSGFEEATAVEYLKTLAISRMVLDNIDNVQADLETQGLKVLQMGLRFGGNDVGSVLWDGADDTTEEDLRRVIRGAGFKPVQRDTLYQTMFLN
ncbi:dehypoxanthine futalosine cyclase [Edaphobacter paludis]|uniref:Dehypoxanthine futalosine cyclase n=1 Tax=Edaphobacter paludis TaxID=3035702 RepID=A0AAU7D785_9BACT